MWNKSGEWQSYGAEKTSEKYWPDYFFPDLETDVWRNTRGEWYREGLSETGLMLYKDPHLVVVPQSKMKSEAAERRVFGDNGGGSVIWRSFLGLSFFKLKSPQTECVHCAHTYTLLLESRLGWRRAETMRLLMCCVLKPLLALISHQANANGQAWMAKTHMSKHRGGTYP